MAAVPEEPNTASLASFFISSSNEVAAPGPCHRPQNEMSWFMLPIQENFVASNFACSLPISGSMAVEAAKMPSSEPSLGARL